jgi:uncharacterized protein
VDSDRVFPLLIGIFEATSIDRRLKGYKSPRPLTHDSWASSIRLLGGEVQHVVVDRLDNHIYYTSVLISQKRRMLRLDVRPSDGFILALLADCPIFINEDVLRQLFPPGKPK